MSFADDVTGYRVSRAKCSVAAWRTTQDAETLAEFDASLLSDVSSKAIWLAMQKRGYTANPQAVSRHRRGDCQCPSPTM